VPLKGHSVFWRVGRLAVTLTALLSVASCVTTSSRRGSIPDSPIQRCVNISNALEAPKEGAWGYTVDLEDIDRIADAGFDTIRLPVRWSAYTARKKPFGISTKFIHRVDEVIDHALKRDLKVVLNIHHYDELNKDADAEEARFIEIWKILASHYRDYPDGLIFEIVNEPNTSMTPRRTDALNRKIVREIRKTNPDRWIVLATAEWGAIRGLVEHKPKISQRTMLTFHYYDPFHFTHQGSHFTKPEIPLGAKWGTEKDYADLRANFEKVDQFRQRYRGPMLLGEFGVYEKADLADRAKWVEAVRKEAEAQEFGWCHWGFTATFNAYRHDEKAWIEPIRDALIEPRPDKSIRAMTATQ
jgi:endoglucanase